MLREILDRIPPHAAAHGFRHERSVKTFAAPHVGQQVVARVDLRDFFPTVPRTRVRGLFLTAGYPGEVASMLAGLCTNQVPDTIWEDFPQFGSPQDRFAHEALYRRPHLPQGAPTSPALANLAAYRLDCRLHGLASAAGARYTRYADDLLFSGGGEFAVPCRRFLHHVYALILEEGFAPHLRKSARDGQLPTPVGRRHDDQPASERAAGRVRSPEGDPVQLRTLRAGESEHGGTARVSPSRGTCRAGRVR